MNMTPEYLETYRVEEDIHFMRFLRERYMKEQLPMLISDVEVCHALFSSLSMFCKSAQYVH